MIKTNSGEFIVTPCDAAEWLESHGFNNWDIEELSSMLQTEEYDDLAYSYESLQQEFKSYEASLDAAQGLFNELLNLCDELSAKERTQAGLKAITTIKRALCSAEVF